MDAVALAQFAQVAARLSGRRTVALTGAGCSTESGIPDYRGPGRAGPPKRPILHDDFLRRPEVRQRYWARATLGWPRFAAAAPNPAHHALAALERAGLLLGVITQNVDRLHRRAGSRRVVELHGALEDVHCLACAVALPRAAVHERLARANQRWLAAELEKASAAAPDGDAELGPDEIAAFHVIACPACDGVLKPDVVFFGGNVARTTVAAAMDLVLAADALLVVGSSLEVYSGYRFVRHAAERGIPVVIVNRGPTRGDPLATCRIDAPAGIVLPALADHLCATDLDGA